MGGERGWRKDRNRGNKGASHIRMAFIAGTGGGLSKGLSTGGVPRACTQCRAGRTLDGAGRAAPPAAAASHHHGRDGGESDGNEHVDNENAGVVSRRAMLRKSCVAFLGLIGAASANRAATRNNDANARESKEERIERLEQEAGPCSNCEGKGKVPCEMCSGTGFWRALGSSKENPNVRYKGVVCPTCEGTGTLPCPICLGTGLGYTKGILRRRTVDPPLPGRVMQS